MSRSRKERRAAERNRTNAQFSTGPKTTEGKAISSQNNFKHGLYSKQLVLPCENAADLDALRLDLRAEHQPANTTEHILVNEMAEHYWRIKRARLFETKILSTELDVAALNAAHRLMSSAECGFHKALKALREMQKTRREGGGFESQIEAPSARAASTFESQTVERIADLANIADHCPAASGGFVPQNAQIQQNEQPLGAKSEATRSGNSPSTIEIPQPPTAADLKMTDEEFSAYKAERKARSEAFLKEYAASGKLTDSLFDQAMKKHVANMK